jgi:hypothetical protein
VVEGYAAYSWAEHLNHYTSISNTEQVPSWEAVPGAGLAEKANGAAQPAGWAAVQHPGYLPSRSLRVKVNLAIVGAVGVRLPFATEARQSVRAAENRPLPKIRVAKGH